eukprot:TRINITY_DN66088_c4_g1_i1.p1 TRINITY_DN66088_c4_g1~~TRINITY_DN66088_c4_g1_i1.p1  ORF type:complete len:836 (-),score=292.00 TRINITY_DN66088_c4_g1_i1:78-2585(-)
MPLAALLVLLLLAGHAATATAGDCWSAGGPTGTNVFAVYVDANNGNDGNAGTKAAPDKTLTRALFGDVNNDMNKALFSGTGSSAANRHLYETLDGRDVFVCLNAGSLHLEALSEWSTGRYAAYPAGVLTVTWTNSTGSQLGPKSLTIQGAGVDATTLQTDKMFVGFESVWKQIALRDVAFVGTDADTVSTLATIRSHSVLDNVRFDGVAPSALSDPKGTSDYDSTWPFTPMVVRWTNVAVDLNDRAYSTAFWVPYVSLGVQGGCMQTTWTNVNVTRVNTGGNFGLVARVLVLAAGEYPGHKVLPSVSPSGWNAKTWIRIDGLRFTNSTFQKMFDRAPVWVYGPFSSVSIANSLISNVNAELHRSDTGILLLDSFTSMGQVEISDTTFDSNSVDYPTGNQRGVVLIAGVNHTTITGSTFSSNTVVQGAVLSMLGWTLSIDSSVFRSNVVYGAPSYQAPSTSFGTAMQVLNGRGLSGLLKHDAHVQATLGTDVHVVEFNCNQFVAVLPGGLTESFVVHPIYVPIAKGAGMPILNIDYRAKLTGCDHQCAPGTAVISPDAPTNTNYSDYARLALLSCEGCGGSTYSKQTAYSGQYAHIKSVATCTVCPPGTRAPYSMRSSECPPCAPGYYSDQPGVQQCTACAAGSSQVMYGQTSCILCAPGTYSAVIGSSICSSCQWGFYTNTAGSTQCTMCPGSEVSNADNTGCEDDGVTFGPGRWILFSFMVAFVASVAAYWRRRRRARARQRAAFAGSVGSGYAPGVLSGAAAVNYQALPPDPQQQQQLQSPAVAVPPHAVAYGHDEGVVYPPPQQQQQQQQYSQYQQYPQAAYQPQYQQPPPH